MERNQKPKNKVLKHKFNLNMFITFTISIFYDENSCYWSIIGLPNVIVSEKTDLIERNQNLKNKVLKAKFSLNMFTNFSILMFHNENNCYNLKTLSIFIVNIKIKFLEIRIRGGKKFKLNFGPQTHVIKLPCNIKSKEGLCKTQLHP